MRHGRVCILCILTAPHSLPPCAVLVRAAGGTCGRMCRGLRSSPAGTPGRRTAGACPPRPPPCPASRASRACSCCRCPAGSRSACVSWRTRCGICPSWSSKSDTRLRLRASAWVDGGRCLEGGTLCGADTCGVGGAVVGRGAISVRGGVRLGLAALETRQRQLAYLYMERR